MPYSSQKRRFGSSDITTPLVEGLGAQQRKGTDSNPEPHHPTVFKSEKLSRFLQIRARLFRMIKARG